MKTITRVCGRGQADRWEVGGKVYICSGFEGAASSLAVGELVVSEEGAEHVAHLHVEIAFAEGTTDDFGGQVRNGWDWLRFQGHQARAFSLGTDV